jgi:adenylylsulfate kinase
VVWLTGLSGAGNSTLSTALAQRLAYARAVALLDSDDIRTLLFDTALPRWRPRGRHPE